MKRVGLYKETKMAAHLKVAAIRSACMRWYQSGIVPTDELPDDECAAFAVANLDGAECYCQRTGY